MTNTTKKSAPADQGQGEARAAFQGTAREGDPLAGLSPEHLQACREAAKIDTLINLTLALLLAKRAKAQAQPLKPSNPNGEGGAHD